MQFLNEQATAAFLESAEIETTHDAGHAVIHISRTSSGRRFVMVNDCFGNTTVSEAS